MLHLSLFIQSAGSMTSSLLSLFCSTLCSLSVCCFFILLFPHRDTHTNTAHTQTHTHKQLIHRHRHRRITHTTHTQTQLTHRHKHTHTQTQTHTHTLSLQVSVPSTLFILSTLSLSLFCSILSSLCSLCLLCSVQSSVFSVPSVVSNPLSLRSSSSLFNFAFSLFFLSLCRMQR